MSKCRAANLLGKVLKSTDPKILDDKLLHLLVNADNGAILAFIGRKEILMPDKILLSPTPVKLVGQTPEKESKEIIHLALKNRQFVLKSRVETESGHYLGRVFDFEFDDISWKIQRIFISDRILFRALTEQLQIPKEDILFIGKDKIIVRDGLIKRENLARVAQPNSEYAGASSGAALSKNT